MKDVQRATTPRTLKRKYRRSAGSWSGARYVTKLREDREGIEGIKGREGREGR